MMRTARTGRGFLSVFLLILMLSCASPFLERAHDSPGFSGGAGVVGVIAEDPGFSSYASHTIVVIPTASARYRFSGGFSLSLVGAAGPSWKWIVYPRSTGRDFQALAILGAKVPVGSHGAIRLDIGAGGSSPWNIHSVGPIVGLTYLLDLSDLWTVSASAGWPVGLGLGVGIHPRIGKHVVTHMALGASAIYSAGLGLGVDFVGSDQPEVQGSQQP